LADIEIKNLTFTYPQSRTQALSDIDLTVPGGQFVLLLGGSGSGKTTLIRAMAGLLKDFYGGTHEGRVSIQGRDIKAFSRRDLVQRVGVVFQDPESQLVMTTGEEEMAFGLENLGLSNSLMQRRIMEVSSALSLSPYKSRYVHELSGGQKQKMVLGSVLAMQPDILLLDEPTSQLDPVAGEEILTLIRRLNEENGITVILAEQKLERCIHFADRIIAMSSGRIVRDSKDVAAIAGWSFKNRLPMVPPLSRLFAGLGYEEIPVTVKEGRRLVKEKSLLVSGAGANPAVSPVVEPPEEVPVLELENLWFAYPDGHEVLKDIGLTFRAGSFNVVMGENGGGKTTLLKQINGLLRPGRGRVMMDGGDIRKVPVEKLSARVAYLSQESGDYLFMPTVREEVVFSLDHLGIPDEGRVDRILEKLSIREFEKEYSRDLSAGERQRVALASVLVGDPRILLLDEPTRGLDYRLKEELGELLLALVAGGMTVIVVSHDVEFAAEYAENIVLLYEGRVVESGDKHRILSDSTFYSPQISKLFKNYQEGVVTLSQGMKLLKNRLAEEA
jgi:energy-coupling factor transport system ATP-binding protein